jgi:hypothetical protein
MERLWTDEIIIEAVWKSFVAKRLGEWEGVIICVRCYVPSGVAILQSHMPFVQSILILTANVGFLAIPGVVLSNLDGSSLTSASQVHIFPSASQIASSLSVEASMGSLVTGLLLVRHIRTKRKEDPASAVSGQSHLTCAPK